jgi:hypothetical protein
MESTQILRVRVRVRVKVRVRVRVRFRLNHRRSIGLERRGEGRIRVSVTI